MQQLFDRFDQCREPAVLLGLEGWKIGIFGQSAIFPEPFQNFAEAGFALQLLLLDFCQFRISRIEKLQPFIGPEDGDRGT